MAKDDSTESQALTRQQIIDRAMSFPMEDVVTRYAKDHDLPLSVAQDHERELKRYLALFAINPDTKYGMRGQIDELWHTFLMFTKEYAQFCNQVAGRFIHHVPATTLPKQGTAKEYERFLTDYEAVYAEPSPPELWPRITRPSDEEESLTPANSCDGCSMCGGGPHCVVD